MSATSKDLAWSALIKFNRTTKWELGFEVISVIIAVGFDNLVDGNSPDWFEGNPLGSVENDSLEAVLDVSSCGGTAKAINGIVKSEKQKISMKKAVFR
jgi:hypothetical protein